MDDYRLSQVVASIATALSEMESSYSRLIWSQACGMQLLVGRMHFYLLPSRRITRSKHTLGKYNNIHLWSCSRAVLYLLSIVIIESKKT